MFERRFAVWLWMVYLATEVNTNTNMTSSAIVSFNGVITTFDGQVLQVRGAHVCSINAHASDANFLNLKCL